MRTAWFFASVLTAALLVASPARAVDKAHPENGKAAAKGKAHDDHKSDGPEFLKPALDLMIWTIVVFLILLFVLGKFAWKPMLEGLAKREHAIAAAIDEAARLREESTRLRAEMVAERQKAHDTARELMEEARRDAQNLKDEMVASAKNEIATERDRLHRELNMAKDQALKQLWERSAELATLVSSKALKRQLTVDDHRGLVDEALAELQHAADERREFVRGHHA